MVSASFIEFIAVAFAYRYDSTYLGRYIVSSEKQFYRR